MSENKKRDIVEVICTFIGILAMVGCIILTVAGSMAEINLEWVILIFAVISVIAHVIKLTLEIISREHTWISSVSCIACACMVIVINASNLL